MGAERFALRPGPFTRCFARGQARVWVDQAGLEIQEEGGTRRLGWAEVGTVELRLKRLLCFAWGAECGQQLELSIGRLHAQDYYDRIEELRQAQRPAGRQLASAENSELRYAQPFKLADVGLGDGRNTGFTVGAPDPDGLRPLQLGAQRYHLLSLFDEDPAAGLQVLDAQRRAVLVILPGRVLSAAGVLVAVFDRLKQAGTRLRGILCHLPDGGQLEIYRAFRALHVAGVEGVLRFDECDAEAELEAEVPDAHLLILAGILAFAHAQKTAAPPLRGPDAGEADEVIRERRPWRPFVVLLAPAVATLAAAVTGSMMIGWDRVGLLLGAGLGGGIAGIVGVYYAQRWFVGFLRRWRRQGELHRLEGGCWTGRGGFHLRDGLLQFCAGMGFQHSIAFSFREVGHLEERRPFNQVSLGLGGGPLVFWRAPVDFGAEQFDALLRALRRQRPGHLVSCRRHKVMTPDPAFAWEKLLPGVPPVETLEWHETGRWVAELRVEKQSFQIRGRRARRLQLVDGLGRIPLAAYRPREICLHNGMVLVELGDWRGRELRLCDGRVLQVDKTTGRIDQDGAGFAEILPGRAGLRFAAPCPAYLALLLAGLLWPRRGRLTGA